MSVTAAARLPAGATLVTLLAFSILTPRGGAAEVADADHASLEDMANDVRTLEVSYRHDATPALQSQLVVAYNNYAVALAQAGHVEEGILQLRYAVKLAPDASRLAQNLANLLVQRAGQLMASRNQREAQALLEEALTYHGDLAEAWAYLGTIHYDAQRTAEAERAWKRALALNPRMANVQARLDQLTQERPVEQSFRQLSQVYFDIRYPEGLPGEAEYELREVLIDARRMIGQDFDRYPSQRITVLLYTPEQFHQLRQETPEWVAGQYDGKLRLPLVADAKSATFRHIVWHEYTHVLVQELSRGHCPTWLNEGLAEYEGVRQEAGRYPWLRKALRSGDPMPLGELDHHFSQAHAAEEAALAYEQSLSLVSFLVDRYGLWRLKRLLKSLGEGTPFAETFSHEFHLRLPEFERRWFAWARESLGTGR